MKKPRIEDPDGFAEFWDAWRPMARHTDGRGLAREAFRKHVQNGADPRDIIDGAKWFLRGVKDRQYVPLSATWLNREPWPDLCEQERAYQARQQQRANPDNVTPIRAVKPANHFTNIWKSRESA